MGWSLGFDDKWNRDIGYGVPAYCDHPKCSVEIDRGLAYVCCDQEPYGAMAAGFTSAPPTLTVAAAALAAATESCLTNQSRITRNGSNTKKRTQAGRNGGRGEKESKEYDSTIVRHRFFHRRRDRLDLAHGRVRGPTAHRLHSIHGHQAGFHREGGGPARCQRFDPPERENHLGQPSEGRYHRQRTSAPKGALMGSYGFKTGDCPKCHGMALGQGRGPLKCRKCGHTFKGSGKNKFNAERSQIEGASFESKEERIFLTQYLTLRLKAKEVSGIEWKPRIEIEPGIHYRPEAVYLDKILGHKVAVDVKGGATKGGRFPTVKKIWRNHMDYPLHVMERSARGRWAVTEKILPRKDALK